MWALSGEPEQAARDVVCRPFPVAQRGRDHEHPLNACRNLYVYMLVLQTLLPCFGSLCFPPKAFGCPVMLQTFLPYFGSLCFPPKAFGCPVMLETFLPCFGSLCFPPKAFGCTFPCVWPALLPSVTSAVSLALASRSRCLLLRSLSCLRWLSSSSLSISRLSSTNTLYRRSLVKG